MTDFKSQTRDIANLLDHMDKNGKKLILKYIIMHDLKLYTEVLFEEQRRLEKECGIKDVEYYEPDENSFDSVDPKSCKDGFLGYVDIDGVKHEYKQEENT